MSGAPIEPGAPRVERDPVLRVIVGCAAVVGVLVVLAIVAIGLIGWNITRDRAPGRPVETLLVGDETRYWRFELKPDDPGLKALVERMAASQEAARDETLRDSPLRYVIPRGRRADLNQIAPLDLELAVAPAGWTFRGTFTKGILRVRAAVTLMRWMIGRHQAPEAPAEIEGVPVATIFDPKRGKEIAMTTVGNRLLVSGASARLAQVLASGRATGTGGIPEEVGRLHDGVRLDGEIGWAFAEGREVASFALHENDELVFRIAVPADISTGAAAGLDADRGLGVVREFLPYLPAEAFAFDGTAPARREDGTRIVSGRVAQLSKRIEGTLLRFSASRTEPPPAPETPSAIPLPPSPPPSSDPRSGTHAAPKHGGSPSPAH